MSPDHPNVALIREFHRRQGEMYAGGGTAAVEELLADGAVWHVPGSSPIAGDHTGREQVLAYFRRRRELAAGTLRLEVLEVIADDEAVVQLADGRARLGGVEASWRTAGVFRVEGGRIAEAWLVPLDLARFDALWSRASAPPDRS